MNHCIAKIVEIISEGQSDRRAILQLGYNLGRLSELTGLGREPFWDAWKDAVAAWDLPELTRLAHNLQLMEISLSESIEIRSGAPNPEAAPIGTFAQPASELL